MGSKKLSFKPKFILRETLRHWPLMASVAGVYLLTITGLTGLVTCFNVVPEDVTEDVVRQMMNVSQFSSFIMGVIVAGYAFGYLGSKKRHYMFESLPMNRTSMFANRFVFGYIVIFIPNLFIFLIETIQIAVITGEFMAGPVLCWLLIISVQNLFWLTFATLFMILCGRVLMASFCYFAFAGLGFIIKYTFAIFNPILFIGYITYGDTDIMNIGILSPFVYVFRMEYGEGAKFLSIDGYYGTARLVTVFIAFVVLFAVSYILYLKRRAERTGDNIVFPFMKKICSWCFTFVFALVLTIMVFGLFASKYEGVSHDPGYKIFLIVSFAVFCIIGYMISGMIIEKKLNIFKKYLRAALICSGVFMIFMIVYVNDVFGYEKSVPDVGDVESVRIYGEQFSNEISYYGQNNEKEMVEAQNKAGVELHRIIVDNMDELIEYYKKIYQPGTYSYVFDGDIDEEPVNNIDSRTIFIEYVLKDGSRISRRYYTKPEGKMYEEIKAFLQKHKDMFFRVSESYNIYY